jgi:hypothetical protein
MKKNKTFLRVMVFACIALLLFSAVAVVVMYLGQPQPTQMDEAAMRAAIEAQLAELATGDVQGTLATGTDAWDLDTAMDQAQAIVPTTDENIEIAGDENVEY